MAQPSQAHIQEEMKVETLARIDAIVRELQAVRVLAAHYWPAGVDIAARPLKLVR